MRCLALSSRIDLLVVFTEPGRKDLSAGLTKGIETEPISEMLRREYLGVV